MPSIPATEEFVADATADNVTQREQVRLLSMFGCDQRSQLSYVAYAVMRLLCYEILALLRGSSVAVNSIQQIVDGDVEFV
jgi:hypothetical protein